MWSRWGDPVELAKKHPSVAYRFKNFGPGSGYDSDVFDRIFSVSTLEHIPQGHRHGVLVDMHRTLARGGIELHAIDILVPPLGTRDPGGGIGAQPDASSAHVALPERNCHLVGPLPEVGRPDAGQDALQLGLAPPQDAP